MTGSKTPLTLGTRKVNAQKTRSNTMKAYELLVPALEKANKKNTCKARRQDEKKIIRSCDFY